MARRQDITIFQSRTGTIKDKVEGVADWTDVNTVLVISDGTNNVVTLTGTVDGPADTLIFPYTLEDTGQLEPGEYDFETIIYKADKSLVQTPTYGKITVKPVLKEDPTV